MFQLIAFYIELGFFCTVCVWVHCFILTNTFRRKD